MSFTDQLTSDLDVFFNTDHFAVSATYTPSGGDATTITVIKLDSNPSIQDPPPAEDELDIKVKVSEVASPNIYDTYTIGGETYYFKEVLGGGQGLTWDLRISRSARRQL